MRGVLVGRSHGCTVSFVAEQFDEGPIILPDVFHISVGADTLDDAKENDLILEANVLCKAVAPFLNEGLVVVEGKVIFKPGMSRFMCADTNKRAGCASYCDVAVAGG